MNINPIKIMQAKAAISEFEKRHPKLRGFVETVSREALKEGTVIEVTVTTPEGKSYITNMKITEEDAALLRDSAKNLPEQK